MTAYMTQVEYSEHRNISQSRVSRLVSKGKIPKNCIKKISGRKLIDRDMADDALKKSLDGIYNPNPRHKASPKKTPPTKVEMQSTANTASTGQLSLADAQRLQAQYKAALLRLEYEQKVGRLVKLEIVDKDWLDVARRTRDAILGISDRIAAELASESDIHTINKRLTEEIVLALMSLKI